MSHSIEILATIIIVFLMFINVIQCYRLKNYRLSFITACILLITPFIVIDSIIYLALLLILNSIIISDLIKMEKINETLDKDNQKINRKTKFLKKTNRIS